MAHGDIHLAESVGTLQLELAHGNMEMKGADKIEGELRHSNATIGGVGNLEIEIHHSNLNLGLVDDLNCDLHHSNANIGKIVRSNIESHHSNLNIGQLLEELVGDAHFGQITIGKLGSGFELIELEMHRGEFKIKSAGAAYSIDFEGQHSDLDVGSGFKYQSRTDNKEGFEQEITGRKGSGGGEIRVKAFHGHVVVE